MLPVTNVLAKKLRDAGVDKDRIVVIPNSINQSRFDSVISIDKAKTALNLKNKFVLGFVGFVRDWHGLERVIDFIVDNPQRNIVLLLVGDGPARESLERRATDFGVRSQLHITGIVQRDQVANFIAAFDIALQPAVAEYACPLKIYEYMAMGKAIIAPASENILEILRDNVTALLFDSRDNKAFKTTLQRLCDDDALQKRLGNNAFNKLKKKNITWESNAKRIVGLYKNLRSSQDHA